MIQHEITQATWRCHYTLIVEVQRKPHSSARRRRATVARNRQDNFIEDILNACAMPLL